MSRHMETEMEKIQRIASSREFIRGDMTICSSDGASYDGDAIMGVREEDLMFLLSKAATASLLEFELIKYKMREKGSYHEEQSNYLKYLEKENDMLFKEMCRMRTLLNEIEMKKLAGSEMD